jgi:hypothetical protein
MEGFSNSVGNLNLDYGSGSGGLLGSSTAPSLSMKMRSEGTKLFSRTSTLPPVSKKSHPKNIHLPKELPKSEVSRMYERLSGQFESEGFEAYPDRGTIHHPSTFCVRCSEHASLCVPCADDMSNKAVTFFRKSQALGAFHLLNGAIKQAGCQKVLRSLIFYLWKNYMREETKKRNKRKELARKKYEIHLMTPTFNSWVSLVKYLIKDKHNKKVCDYEDRIKLLEAQVQKLNTERNVADFQAKKAQKAFDTCLALSEEQASTITHLTETLYKDQFRVLKLSTFIHSVTPHLFSMLNRSAKGTIVASGKHVQFCQSITASSMNYAKVLKPSGKGNKKGTSTPSSAKAKVTPGVISWSDRAPELIAWINHQSKNANMMTHKCGDETIELDKFLPPFRDIRKMTELRNGQQLCRVVVKLVLALQNQRASVPKPPPCRVKDGQGPCVPSAPPPSHSKAGGGKEDQLFTFTRDHAQDIKENVAVSHGLIYLTQTLMVSALKCPEVSIDQIESGDPLALEALIGSLMLISADIAGEVSTEDKADLVKFSGTIDAVKNEIDKKITKTIVARMLTFPESFFRDEEKEKRLEEERQFALEHKDRIRKEKREAEKAARLEAKRRPSNTSESKDTDVSEETTDEELDSKGEEEKVEEKKENSNVDPVREFVDSYAEQYQDITKIIDTYFGTVKSEKLDELTGCIGTLEEDMKTASDQMGVILRKEKAAFSNLQFTIRTNNQIALSNTSRMLSAAGSKD